MWYLYLDESGDLGFDFVQKRPSRHFTVTVVLLRSHLANRALQKAVAITLRRKLKGTDELKGSKQSLNIKQYFYRFAKEVPFEVYAITINKQKVYQYIYQNPERLYNYVARKVLDAIPFEVARGQVTIIFDRCKSKPQIAAFNRYLASQLEGRLEPSTPLDMEHLLSHDSKNLQACDLFCNGIFTKYESKDTSWYDIFKPKISKDDYFFK
jgi:hypothetical protein